MNLSNNVLRKSKNIFYIKCEFKKERWNIMKEKKVSIAIISSVLVVLVGLVIYAKCFYKKPYPYVYCNENYFYVTGEPIAEDELDTQISEVKNVTKKKKHNEDGDSNTLEVGAKIYKVKGQSNYEYIATEKDNDFVIARLIHEKQ